MTSDTEYDVALSFAGEDREYVEHVAKCLQRRGMRVFYDRSEEVELWGKDLAVALDEVYRKKARRVVLFISAAYARKAWTTFEKGCAIAGAIARIGQDFILPARFDDTEIPSLNPGIGYVDLRTHTAPAFAKILVNKVRGNEPPIAHTEPVSLTSLLDGYLRVSPFHSQDEILHALDLNDWPVTVSLGMLKKARKPAKTGELTVTGFKPDVLFRIILSTQAEHVFTFKLMTQPSHELRGKYRERPGSALHFVAVPFGSPDHREEYVTGNVAYETCNKCEGAGTVTETCSFCGGKGKTGDRPQVRCHKCRRGKIINICPRCAGTGYLDEFPFTGRRVFRRDHVLLTGTRGGNAGGITPPQYCVVYRGPIQGTLPTQVPFNCGNGELARQYAAVLTIEQRRDPPPEASAYLVSDEPFMEKRQISIRQVHLNGCQFRVEACKIYRVSYTREVTHVKGVWTETKMTTRIAGSLVIVDDGNLAKLAGSHREQALR